MNDQMSVSHDATLTLHAGAGPREVGLPASSPPVMATSFFTHPDAIGFSANDLSEAAPHFYTRWSNPTLELLESRLAALESGEAALSFASGMAAISALFLDRLGSGGHRRYRSHRETPAGAAPGACTAGAWYASARGLGARRRVLVRWPAAFFLKR
jgi:cystathionine beta-lyase/cystathionine gamma-synthase